MIAASVHDANDRARRRRPALPQPPGCRAAPGRLEGVDLPRKALSRTPAAAPCGFAARRDGANRESVDDLRDMKGDRPSACWAVWAMPYGGWSSAWLLACCLRRVRLSDLHLLGREIEIGRKAASIVFDDKGPVVGAFLR